MLGSLGHLLVGLIDDIMVGRLGPVSLAATSLGNSLVFIALAIGIGFSLAITPLIAESEGAGELGSGRRIFQHGLVLNSLMGLAMFGMLLLIKPVLYHLDQPEEVVLLAIPYYEIVAISMIPLMVFQSYKQFTDGLSQTRYAMYATVLANLLNVLLNWVLIYGLWFFPRLEIVGAAIGTLVSRISMVFFIYWLLSGKDRFSPYMRWLRIHDFRLAELKKILSLGFPTALQVLFEVGLFTASVLLAGTFGALAQAANQIALKLASTTFMIAVGLGAATTIRVGNQKGLKDFPALRRIAFSNFMLIVVIMGSFSIGFLLFKDQLPLMFTDNDTVIATASSLLVIAALFQLSDGLQAVVLGALRGLQDVKIPSLLTFVAYWLIGFPICYCLGLYLEWGPYGVWIGLLVALSASAAMLLLRFHFLSHKLIQKNHELTRISTR